MADMAVTSDSEFLDHYLQGVSRSFAFTIPQLPSPLSRSVATAYLLCRIADTIEDEPRLDLSGKHHFLQRWASLVRNLDGAPEFASELCTALSTGTPEIERDLVSDVPRVIEITARFSPVVHAAMANCIEVMSAGMARFQERANRRGLADMAEMNRYCYHVAGIVGEMLTELFCDHSEEIAVRREELMSLAASHGQALQMTNILKDLWDDLDRGACWLPRNVFRSEGFDLGDLTPGSADPGFVAGLNRLIAITRHHQGNALRYIQLLPAREVGIRRHCLWPLGMAVLTLRRIHSMPEFRSGEDVKISRRQVRIVIITTKLLTRSNAGLDFLFSRLHRGMPSISETDLAR